MQKRLSDIRAALGIDVPPRQNDIKKTDNTESMFGMLSNIVSKLVCPDLCSALGRA